MKIIFDFSRVPLILWGVFITYLIGYTVLTGHFIGEFVFRWGFLSLLIILLISIDLMGSTPLYKSGLHEERWLKIFLDAEKCKAAAFCEDVCPRSCYEVDKSIRITKMVRINRCVQCGACIVQCLFDALSFKSPSGEIISPEIIRRFKLNLMGKRLVKVKGNRY